MTLPAGTPALQQVVAAACRELHQRGWVANHDGNVSVRQSDGVRFVASPTATSKRLVSAADTLTVDLAGKRLGGRRRLFGEWHLHRACYEARPDVRCVIHAHPRYATALGICRRQLGVPTLPEMIVSLGANIPTIPYALPKSAKQNEDLAEALTAGDADAVLLEHNGVVAVGEDVEQALLRLELVEHYAGIVHAALPLGGPVPLAGSDVETLLAARTKAGLGRAGRAAR